MKGYYSLGLCGYEVEISDDGESAHYRFVGLDKEQPRYRSKIYYTRKGRPYLRTHYNRIYLDECLRSDI
jgi:hypothetical protein